MFLLSPEPQPWWVAPGKQILFRTVPWLETNEKWKWELSSCMAPNWNSSPCLPKMKHLLTPKQQELDPQWTRAPPADTCPFADFPTALHWVCILCSLEEKQQLQKSVWIFHVFTAKASSGTSAFSYTFGSWALGLKLLNYFFSPLHHLAMFFFPLQFQNWFFLSILHRIPENNNLDIKWGSHYMLICGGKQHFWKCMF